MKNFEYCVPTNIIFGKDTHKEIGSIIKKYEYKRVLLHYGQESIKKSGLYDEVTASLKEHGIRFAELGGVEPNPKLSLAKKGVALCKAESCDMILAVGGGSVTDSAKLIAVGALADCELWDFPMKKEIPAKALPIGVISTIAASGSEMSTSCVITKAEGNLKRSFSSQILRPVFAIMNPELTYSVSKYQTGCGIADIIMHTLDRYFMDLETADLTDHLAEGLLKSVIAAGKTALENPCDYEARATLLLAGSLSHNDLTGLGRTYVMPCHQMEHELSGMYDFIAHAAGLTAIWPSFARYVYKHAVERFCRYAVRVWNIDMDFENPERTALAGIAATEKYFESIGMPVRLSQFNIEGELKIEEMAEKCTFFGARTLPSPVTLGKKEIMEIFKMAEH